MSATNTTTPAAAQATDARARLLEAIEEASFEPTAQETHADPHPQVRHQRDTWRNHIVTAFFLGDEARMFRELRISSVVFEEIVNAVADLPLQRRGRRAFIFTHRERVLFLHVFLAFGLHVAHILVLPRIKSASEVNAIAKKSPYNTIRESAKCTS